MTGLVAMGTMVSGAGGRYGDISLEVLAEAVNSITYRGLKAVAAKSTAKASP